MLANRLIAVIIITSTTRVWRMHPETEVMLAVMILRLRDSKTSQTLIMVSLFLMQVMFITIVLFFTSYTLSFTPPKNKHIHLVNNINFKRKFHKDVHNMDQGPYFNYFDGRRGWQVRAQDGCSLSIGWSRELIIILKMAHGWEIKKMTIK